MDLAFWTVFVVASLPIHFAPGPNNVIAFQNGGIFGVRTAGQAMIGRLPGYGLIFLAAGLGVGASLTAQPAMFGMLKVAGGFYLAWTGLTMASSHRAEDPSKDAAATAAHGQFRREFLVAVSNPKAILFATAFYMQFLVPGSSEYTVQYTQMVLVSLSIEMLAGLTYCCAGALIGGGPGRVRLLVWIARSCGVLLSGVGVLLTVEGLCEITRNST